MKIFKDIITALNLQPLFITLFKGSKSFEKDKRQKSYPYHCIYQKKSNKKSKIVKAETHKTYVNVYPISDFCTGISLGRK